MAKQIFCVHLERYSDRYCNFYGRCVETVFCFNCNYRVKQIKETETEADSQLTIDFDILPF